MQLRQPSALGGAGVLLSVKCFLGYKIQFVLTIFAIGETSIVRFAHF